jgi:hypothetical protein
MSSPRFSTNTVTANRKKSESTKDVLPRCGRQAAQAFPHPLLGHLHGQRSQFLPDFRRDPLVPVHDFFVFIYETAGQGDLRKGFLDALPVGVRVADEIGLEKEQGDSVREPLQKRVAGKSPLGKEFHPARRVDRVEKGFDGAQFLGPVLLHDDLPVGGENLPLFQVQDSDVLDVPDAFPDKGEEAVESLPCFQRRFPVLFLHAWDRIFSDQGIEEPPPGARRSRLHASQRLDEGIQPVQRFLPGRRFVEEDWNDVADRLFPVRPDLESGFQYFEVERGDHPAGADAPLVQVGELERLALGEQEHQKAGRAAHDEPSHPAPSGFFGGQLEVVAGALLPVARPERRRDFSNHEGCPPPVEFPA